MQKEYKRDKRSPKPKNATVSKVMSRNMARGTKPEILLRKELWASNIKGYRLNYKKVAGRPDIAFPGKKIALFVNGCFWHRCPKCAYTLPKHNTEFWANKFKKNIERDQRKVRELQAEGWQTIIIWECEIKENINTVVTKVAQVLNTFGSE